MAPVKHWLHGLALADSITVQSVNPKATVTVVFTANWCDPAKQTEAVKTSVAGGIDVVTQHQDCAKAIVEASERAGIMSVGYHADGSVLAPKGWITGSQWDWGKLYVDIAQTIAASPILYLLASPSMCACSPPPPVRTIMASTPSCWPIASRLIAQNGI